MDRLVRHCGGTGGSVGEALWRGWCGDDAGRYTPPQELSQTERFAPGADRFFAQTVCLLTAGSRIHLINLTLTPQVINQASLTVIGM